MIPRSFFDTGFYIVSVITGSGSLNYKLVVQ